MTGRAGRAAALALAAAVAACAPVMQRVGPMNETARIDHGVLVARDGARLPLRIWKPDGAPPRIAVAALHGFNDYSNAFDAPARRWAKRGIVTYAIDQRGFGAAPRPGLWAGTAAMTADLAALVAAVRRRHPGLPLYLVGDSMGGAVVLAALGGRERLAADGAVLIAPAVWGRDHLGPVKSATLWLAAHLVPWFPATAEGLDITPSDNEEMLRALARDPLVLKETRIDALWGLVNLMDEAKAAAARIDIPVLLLYGTRDEIIPFAPTAQVIAALARRGRPRTAFYPSGFHMLLRDLGAAEPTADIAHWMAAPNAPLPSGADRRPPPAP